MITKSTGAEDRRRKNRTATVQVQQKIAAPLHKNSNNTGCAHDRQAAATIVGKAAHMCASTKRSSCASRNRNISGLASADNAGSNSQPPIPLRALGAAGRAGGS